MDADETTLLEREADLAAAACHALDPHGFYGQWRQTATGWTMETHGLDVANYIGAEEGSFMTAVLTARLEYYTARFHALTERDRARQAYADAAAHGLHRFLDGDGPGLDELARITRSTPGAMTELQQERIDRGRTSRAQILADLKKDSRP
jgi:hypothetical protein